LHRWAPRSAKRRVRRPRPVLRSETDATHRRPPRRSATAKRTSPHPDAASVRIG
jgi:hypothetical protein